MVRGDGGIQFQHSRLVGGPQPSNPQTLLQLPQLPQVPQQTLVPLAPNLHGVGPTDQGVLLQHRYSNDLGFVPRASYHQDATKVLPPRPEFILPSTNTFRAAPASFQNFQYQQHQQPQPNVGQFTFQAPHVVLSNDQNGVTSSTSREFNAAAVRPQQRRIAQLQQEPGASQASEAEEHAAKSDSHLKGLKRIPDPPNLEAWRQKLFNVDDTIVLTEDQLQTYFPHVDNVYSHRSTQKHKRKGFVSHYWDCRLKGRPPGTPKSDDPNKKKRKRVARERDLCDVKIRITEYPAGGAPPEVIAQASGHPELDAPQPEAYFTHQSSDAPLAQSSQWPQQANGSYGKIFTIQRVNGNGQNGKGDGVPGAHKHTLEYSDSVKKNSVIRWMLQTEKEKKKSQKEYHKKATGNALNTVKSHSKECDLKLYGSCFCPFVQRVWISLEVKGIPYQYIEVDPYKKPDLLLQINPRGLVPALRHGDWGCYESTVLMEYLEDLSEGQALLPPQPKTRAHSRLWSDHINRHIIPSFYRFLQEQDPQKQVTLADELKTEIGKIVDVADPNGPFFLGPDISFVDIQMAPWVVRLNRVLKPYRGWPEPEPDSRWGKWVKAIEENEHVRATTSTDELYLDSYERYAENRPNTSQVANSVNSGRGLP